MSEMTKEIIEEIVVQKAREWFSKEFNTKFAQLESLSLAFHGIKHDRELVRKEMQAHADGVQEVYGEVKLLSESVLRLEANQIEKEYCECDSPNNWRECPFCASHESLCFNEEVGSIECANCEARGPMCDTQCDAVIEWNMRHDAS